MGAPNEDYYTENCEPYARLYLPRLAANEEGLLQVNLCGRYVTDECLVQILTALKGNTNVEKIILNENRITDVGAQHLAAFLVGPDAAHIHTLELDDNRLTDAGADALREALTTNNYIRHVSMTNEDLSCTTEAMVLEAVERNRHPLQLKKALLLLPMNDVTIVDLSAPPTHACPGYKAEYTVQSTGLLAYALHKNTSITCLNMSNNNRGDDATDCLAAALFRHPTLVELHLAGNEITNTGVQSLCEALRTNTTLTDLILDDNEIGDAGADELLEVMKVNESLSRIMLEKNNVSPQKRSQVAHSLLINAQPVKLKLMYDQLFLNNSRTTVVILDGASLDSDGRCLNDVSCRVLSNCLGSNTTVRRLVLPNNNIRDEGAGLLGLLLARNSTIEHINLRNNRITEVGAEHFAKALTRNTTCTEINLDAQKPSPIPEDSPALKKVRMSLTLNTEPLALKWLVPLLQVDDASVTIVDVSAFDSKRKPSAATCQLIAESLKHNTHVKELNFSHNPQIDSTGLGIIFDTVRNLRQISTLRLGHMKFTDEHQPMVTGLLKMRSGLTALDLSGNYFTKLDDWIEELLEHNHSITSIDLTGSIADANPKEVKELETILKINAQPLDLKRLILKAYNNDPSLKEINLAHTSKQYIPHSMRASRDMRAKLLCESLLLNRYVTKVDLAYNDLGDNGAAEIARMLKKNRSITTMNVTGNNISDSGFIAIRNALLSNPTLHCLVVDDNPIHDPATRKHLNLATAHNAANAANMHVYSVAVEEGTGVLEEELEAAVLKDSLAEYQASKGNVPTIQKMLTSAASYYPADVNLPGQVPDEGGA